MALSPPAVFAIGTAVGAGGGLLLAKDPLKGLLIGSLVGMAAGGVGAGITYGLNQGFLNIGKLGAPPGLGLLPHPPSRPSCLDCVQKHVGSAWSLMGEVPDGYPEHRLLAIGNLREAEEESQAYATLHNMLRHARKAYTANSTIPDFKAITAEIDRIRGAT
jgi:hypothetical protein